MTTEPVGLKSLQVFDLLGRTTHSIANNIGNSDGPQDYCCAPSDRASCR